MPSPTATASEQAATSATPVPPAESGEPGEPEEPEEPGEPGEPEESTSDATAPGAGSYITLAEYEADPASYAGTDVVLFFNARWCSTCKVARDNIQADLASIPPDLTIVVVDFDTANDLRRTYGVTVQHTFVQVDADGTELAKWAGSVTVDQIAKNTV